MFLVAFGPRIERDRTLLLHIHLERWESLMLGWKSVSRRDSLAGAADALSSFEGQDTQLDRLSLWRRVVLDRTSR